MSNSYEDDRRGYGIVSFENGFDLGGSNNPNYFSNLFVGIDIRGNGINTNPINIESFKGNDNICDINLNNKSNVSVYYSLFNNLNKSFNSDISDIKANNCPNLEIKSSQFKWAPTKNFATIKAMDILDCQNPMIRNCQLQDQVTTGVRTAYKGIHYSGDNSNAQWSCIDFDIEHQFLNSYDVFITGPGMADQGNPTTTTGNMYNASPKNLNDLRVKPSSTIYFNYYAHQPDLRNLSSTTVSPNITHYTNPDPTFCSNFEPNDGKALANQSVSRYKCSIYPNPANNNLTIEFNQAQGHLRILSINGKVMLANINLVEGTNQLNIANLPKGMYVIEIQTENGITTQKFLKE